MADKYEIIQAMKREDMVEFRKIVEGAGLDVERMTALVEEARGAAESLKPGDRFRGGMGEFRHRYPDDNNEVALSIFTHSFVDHLPQIYCNNETNNITRIEPK
jgi:hypothetical protein